jgi:uncharacterized protein YkwD
MHAVTTLSLLALAGSALASPHVARGQPHVVYTTEVYTVVVTANGPPPPEQTYAPKPRPHKPTKKPAPTVVYTTAEPPKPTQEPEQPTTPVPEPEQPTYAPEPEQPTTVAPPPPAETGSGDSGYMATVNEWRAKLGLKDLIYDATLESNARNTCDEGNGEMKHKLNPGTMGQVLAPGEMATFEHVFVGGWLCELPDMPGMDGVCAEQSKGWTYQGQTGHAEILTSPNYSKIGCACVDGIVGCDLG